MADVARLLTRHTAYSVIAPTAGAAAFTVPLGYSDHRGYLVVNNRNTDVEVRANVAAGDGANACLGDLDVDIAVSSAAVISFKDSARFKVMTTNSVTVNLRDTADTTLTATPLALIDLVLIQG
jgi:hypothetical protein